MYTNERAHEGRDNTRLNLRGKRPYLRDPKRVTLRELDPGILNRAIDAGASLQRMGIRVALGIIDPTIPQDRLRSNLASGEIVLYKKDPQRETAAVDVPYCTETVSEGIRKRPTQRIQNVILTDIVPIR